MLYTYIICIVCIYIHTYIYIHIYIYTGCQVVKAGASLQLPETDPVTSTQDTKKTLPSSWTDRTFWMVEKIPIEKTTWGNSSCNKNNIPQKMVVVYGIPKCHKNHPQMGGRFAWQPLGLPEIRICKVLDAPFLSHNEAVWYQCF